MPEDGFDELRRGVDAAHAAAERLVREAEEAARAAFADVPPGGWASTPPASRTPGSDELRALVSLLELLRDALRDRIPPELAEQLARAFRELLLALRALIDWYLDRREQPRPSGDEGVEDIPIA